MIARDERTFGFRFREEVQAGFVLSVVALHHRRLRPPKPAEMYRNAARGRHPGLPIEEIEYTWSVILNERLLAQLKPLLNRNGVVSGRSVFHGKSAVEAARLLAQAEIARRLDTREGQ